MSIKMEVLNSVRYTRIIAYDVDLLNYLQFDWKCSSTGHKEIFIIPKCLLQSATRHHKRQWKLNRVVREQQEEKTKSPRLTVVRKMPNYF